LDTLLAWSGEFEERPPYSTTLFSALWSNLMPAGNVFLDEGVVVDVFVVVLLSVRFFGRRGNHRDIVNAH
jgi:hypothetical protein